MNLRTLEEILDDLGLEEEIANMTPEEIKEYLKFEGIDVTEAYTKLLAHIAGIKK